MKKFNLIVIIIVLVITAVICAAVYKKINNENKANNQRGAAEIIPATPPNPMFNPYSLNWEQVLLVAPWEGRDSHAVVVFKNKIS